MSQVLYENIKYNKYLAVNVVYHSLTLNNVKKRENVEI